MQPFPDRNYARLLFYIVSQQRKLRVRGRRRPSTNINNMLLWSLLFKPLDHPNKSLIAVFVVWKSLLLLIAASSPGPGYDTSTTLAQPYDGTAEEIQLVSLLRFLSTKLTRWDAIYFTRIASRGYLYEQEWAFGWGFTGLIRFFASGTIFFIRNHVLYAKPLRFQKERLSRLWVLREFYCNWACSRGSRPFRACTLQFDPSNIPQQTKHKDRLYYCLSTYFLTCWPLFVSPLRREYICSTKLLGLPTVCEKLWRQWARHRSSRHATSCSWYYSWICYHCPQ